MTNVIALKDHKKIANKEQEVEAEFVELLAKEVEIEGNVVPLSHSLLERMQALKAAGDRAREDDELLEG